MKNADTKIAVMATDINYIKEKIDELCKRMESDYVTKAEFDPIKRIVYGMVGLILVGVVGGLLALLFR
jgi:hypothetical protein